MLSDIDERGWELLLSRALLEFSCDSSWVAAVICADIGSDKCCMSESSIETVIRSSRYKQYVDADPTAAESGEITRAAVRGGRATG